MFTSIERDDLNDRAIQILENAVVNEKLDRFILFGKDSDVLTRLSQHFLTALNARKFKTLYININDMLRHNMAVKAIEEGYDLIVLDGFFKSMNLTEEELINLHNFLSVFQHDNIFFTCELTPEQVFSEEVRYYIDNGITWSRNFLGCKQLFMNDTDRFKYLKLLREEKSSDYRIIQSIDFLKEEISPYYELKFINKNLIKNLLINGDDSVHNCLVLTREPKLRLKLYKDLRAGENAVRLETFMAGNGYVGKGLILSEVNNYYRLLLEGYYYYLNQGTEIFMDTSLDDEMTEEQLVERIKKMNSK